MRGVSFLILMCMASWAIAAPSEAPDDELLVLLQERGLIAHLGDQIREVGAEVGEHSSTLVANALGFLGVPYRYGGASANDGVDCSGLVKTVFQQSLGMILPHRAEQQAAVTQVIERNQLQPGDLVFFNTMRRAFSHVGIYLGEGKFIHSPRSGAQVRIEDMRMTYWQKRFNGARRVAAPASQPATVEAPR